MRTIETLSAAKAENTRAAMPTLPFMPGPATVSIAKLSRLDNALTGASPPLERKSQSLERLAHAYFLFHKVHRL